MYYCRQKSAEIQLSIISIQLIIMECLYLYKRKHLTKISLST